MCLSLFLRFVSSTSVDLAPSYLRSKHSIPEAPVASFPLSLSLCFLIFSVRTEEREGKGGREGHAEGGGLQERRGASF